ncbi:hypothetical protein N7466_003452 [Penicillium verhagenii]|uniref:uncharacterized protein n=1 Tax=Penicillium verhagenii TaxID=1562060 RepID=UPI002544EB2F|nr:uncharacterized protein N7466_003452 [Penicillium verhagenii]KAJ5937002.1 hypothetical protein N7466_003452 [Penicillium verhagenii]
MDHLRTPVPLSAKPPSATFPPTHGSTRPNVTTEPLAQAGDQLSRNELEPTETRSSHRHLTDWHLDGAKLHSHRHKHSKSREIRLPRHMSHLASSASARGLLPTWSGGREKDREEDGLLRPMTRETTRSRWGSDSTSGLGSSSRSRKGSILDPSDQQGQLGPIRRQEIQSLEELGQVTKRRKQGEQYLRSALSSIATLATDVTRRLDYTYYNLLEKITALNSTIGSFQDLSDSASTLLNDFERETAGLDQEIRKQINDLQGFQPQIQKADALDKRMKAGRQRVEDLGKRLESVRGEIDRWDQRESEWQSRVSRRLRIFWAVISSSLLVLVLALVIQNWPALQSPSSFAEPSDKLNQTSLGATPSDTWESVLSDAEDITSASWYPSGLADRRQSLEQANSITATSSRASSDAVPTDLDPLRVLDEL